MNNDNNVIDIDPKAIKDKMRQMVNAKINILLDGYLKDISDAMNFNDINEKRLVSLLMILNDLLIYCRENDIPFDEILNAAYIESENYFGFKPRV